jgi:hypothetical protein
MRALYTVSPPVLNQCNRFFPQLWRAALITSFITLILSLTAAYLANIRQTISLFKSYLTTYRLIIEAASTEASDVVKTATWRQQTTILASAEYIKEIKPRLNNGVIAEKSLNIPL